MDTTQLKPGARTFVVHDGEVYDPDEIARLSPGRYEQAFLDRRRRDKRIMERVLWASVGAMLAIMALMALFGTGTPPAGAAATSEARVVCKPACQLERRLRAVCPSQPGAMTRRTCRRWVLVGQCETGGQQTTITLRSIGQIRWRYNGSSGYDGGLQFSPSTWRSNVARIPSRQLTRPERIARNAGRYHHAWSAPPSVQILAAEVLRKRIGGNPKQSAGWPHCGAWWYR